MSWGNGSGKIIRTHPLSWKIQASAAFCIFSVRFGGKTSGFENTTFSLGLFAFQFQVCFNLLTGDWMYTCKTIWMLLKIPTQSYLSAVTPAEIVKFQEKTLTLFHFDKPALGPFLVSDSNTSKTPCYATSLSSSKLYGHLYFFMLLVSIRDSYLLISKGVGWAVYSCSKGSCFYRL